MKGSKAMCAKVMGVKAAIVKEATKRRRAFRAEHFVKGQKHCRRRELKSKVCEAQRGAAHEDRWRD